MRSALVRDAAVVRRSGGGQALRLHCPLRAWNNLGSGDGGFRIDVSVVSRQLNAEANFRMARHTDPIPAPNGGLQRSAARHNQGEEAQMPSFEFVAVLAATLFTGAALYINFAEHPARMECGTVVAATVFGPSYRRAAVMQVILALLASAAGISAWLTGAPASWLAGAVLIFAVVPFTLLAIRPTNNQLLDPAADRASDRVRRLLQRWGRLHAVRSLLALASSTVFVASVVWSST
jgi:Domain of unknown function (DUF1772)